jgi:DNA-binding LacI/PurR family transcriptional regulator
MRNKQKETGSGTPPATMAELAARLGVSPSLVSMALSGDAKVAAKTRERIAAAAREMGFTRNATASLLAKQRHSRRAEAGRLSVALVSTLRDESLTGICAERGVALEQVVMRPEDSPRQLLKTLWNRGVNGILLSPDQTPWRGALDKLPWQDFSMVKLGRVHPELPFHLVRHDAFDFATLALQRSCSTAKKRVCVLLWETDSEIDNQARLGALLAFRETRLPPGLELEWRLWKGPINRADPDSLAWLRARKPDTVLLFHFIMLFALEQAGLPDSFRCRFFAMQNVPEFPWLKRPLAGCDVSRESYLANALDLLLVLIGRGERGFASPPTEHVIEPVWVGES